MDPTTTALLPPEAVAAIEREAVPFDEPAFRADLQAWAEGGRELSRRFAADAVLLSRLAQRVPRSRGDERGGSAWTSFLREVAVARRASDRAAHGLVREAQLLVALMPLTLELLRCGLLPVPQARALVDMARTCEEGTVAALDALAERACRLPTWRVKEAARKVVLQREAEAVAARSAVAARDRTVRATPLADEQAEVALVGPALALAQALAALDADAHALRSAGDARGLGALRFDLAVHRLLGAHAPVRRRTAAASTPSDTRSADTRSADTHSADTHSADTHSADTHSADTAPADCADGLPDPTSPTWWTDRRFTRPVRLDVTVPVTTALGLSDEPGWLPGHGWISAPQCRQLLARAELRQVCQADTGEVVDAADRPVRPAPAPAAVAEALRAMVLVPFAVTDKAWRVEPEHDPTPALREFVVLRDGHCDGPTGSRTTARRSDLDHEVPWPEGPTAAWNLAARSRRTHELKHRGWTPVRTADRTLWFSPAGQVLDVPRWGDPPQALDDDAELPDLTALVAVEAELLRPPVRDDVPPQPPPF